MAKYYTTYFLKGKYTEIGSGSEKILSCVGANQYGVQLASLFNFTEYLIKKQNVQLVLIIVDSSFSPVNFAGLEEISGQMEKLRNHNIHVYLYAPSYNMSTLYLAASAEKVFIHPIGNICFGGFYKNRISAAPLLEKLGIKFQTIKTGKFKDTFSSLGDFVEESNFPNQLLQDYEYTFVQQVQKKWKEKDLYRKLSEENIFSAGEAKKIGFLDEIATLPEVLQEITENGIYPKKIKISLKNSKNIWKKKIAIVFANGEIIDGTGAALFHVTKKNMSSSKIIGIINRLKRKKSIKAVLFRIDSTGGSSSAGYDLYQAVKRLSEQKLTVISIGNYATSSAYWMALGGSTIFADSTSVIGAVGAAMTRPYILEALEKIGLQVTTEKLENTEVINFFEEYSEEAKRGTEKWISEIMNHFLEAIREHCDLDKKTLEIISDGCSFSGSYAWKHGLIDQIGGIEQALEYIRTQLGEVPVKYEYYPENKIPLLYKKLFHIASK